MYSRLHKILSLGLIVFSKWMMTKAVIILMDHFKLANKPKLISYSTLLIVLTSCMLSAIVARGIQVLQVKLRARLFFKTTCSYTCVTSWQYSFYITL